MVNYNIYNTTYYIPSIKLLKGKILTQIIYKIEEIFIIKL